MRGSALWDELVDEKASAARKVLAGEACRLADRLDRLDAVLSGDVEVWARLVHRTQTADYELKIDAAAAEARHSATALRQVLAQLAGEQTESTGGSIADEIAARRAERQSKTAG